MNSTQQTPPLYKNLPVPVLAEDESYPYLGIDINLKLNFEEYRTKQMDKYKHIISIITKKKYTTDQAITLIIQVAHCNL